MILEQGTRVQLHPATDRWMMGDRFGEIIGRGKTSYLVKLDKSGKTVHVHPKNLLQIT
jgi:hypothetical protein